MQVHLFRPFRAFRPSKQVLSGTDIPCAYHRGNLATESCARCGSFICDLCATPIESKTYCSACFERLNASGSLQSVKQAYSRPHIISFAFAFFSGVPLLGIILIVFSLIYGIRAVRAREELLQREASVLPWVVFAFLFDLGGLMSNAAIFLST